MTEKLSTIYQRIDKVLTDKGLVKANGKPNYAQAERLCGIKGTVLSKAAQRKGTLSDSNKEKFLRTFHVKSRWFDTGEGDIYKEGTPSENVEFQVSVEILQAWLADKQKIIESQDKEINLLRTKLKESERKYEEVKKII